MEGLKQVDQFRVKLSDRTEWEYTLWQYPDGHFEMDKLVWKDNKIVVAEAGFPFNTLATSENMRFLDQTVVDGYYALKGNYVK